MAMPPDVPVIDLLLGLPSDDRRWWASSMGSLLKDKESQTTFRHAASYMYKDLPELDPDADVIDQVVHEMDRYNVVKALLPVSFSDTRAIDALRRHPDRFLGSIAVDPNNGVEELRMMSRAKEELGVVAAQFFPCGCVPHVPINDKRAYPVYAKCVELGLPLFVNVGVPGPRVPMEAQKVEHLDEVCWFFPELVLVMRHGGEPWEALAVKLMLKWPNLHYSTSAFAPKHYPKAIIDYANTRGADRVMYAGYFPYGLSLERIFSELPGVPLREDVWPKFLHQNARRILGLEGS